MKKIFRSISGKNLFNYSLLPIITYFIFHSIYGDRGIISYFSVSGQLEKSYETLESLRVTRMEIEHRLNLLKSGDRDIIDEEARRTLGFATPEEKIFKADAKNEN